MMWPQAQECRERQQLEEAGSPSGASRGSWACPHLDLRLWLQGWERTDLVAVSHVSQLACGHLLCLPLD